MALPYDRRPLDESPLHTVELPETPQRDHNIPALDCGEPRRLAGGPTTNAGDKHRPFEVGG